MNKYGISEAKSSVGFKTHAVPNIAHVAKKSVKGLLLRGAIFVTAFSMVFSVFTPVSAGNDKIKICHASSSHSNPYQKNEPDKNGTVDGHSGHNGPIWYSGITQNWGDIIPSFTYWQNGPKTYPGKNWNAQGQAIWDADCKAGTLTLVKVVEGSNAPVSDWTLSADGTYDFSGVSGTAAVTNVLVPAKQYTLSESGPGGYDASSWTCKDKGNNQPVTVTNGNKVNIPDKKDISCTITNTKQQPRVGELTLIKIVSGGNEQASAWTLYADGETDISGATGSASVTDAEVLPGTYTLSESGPEGYTGIWSCEETSDKSTVVIDDNQIVIEAGDDITCTITNTYTPDPEVPLLHFIKVVCDEYGDVVANVDADNNDDTGGKYNLLKAGPPVKPVSPNKIPGEEEGCYRADGWNFKLATDLPQNQNVGVVGPTAGGEFVTPISGEGSALTEEQQGAIRNGQLWISEVQQPGYGFAAIRCYNDALNGDNLEYIALGNDNPEHIYCIAYNIDIDDEDPCVEGKAWAADVVSNTQGKRKDGTPVLVGRSDPNLALGVADWVSGTGTKFYSLGFGGVITVKFEGYVLNVNGDDLSIHEATNGQYPEETVKIEVSKDGDSWYTLTEDGSNYEPGGITYVDFNESGYDWIQYVRLTDTSNPASFSNDADGFDLDAVDATQQVCEPPVVEEECEEYDLVDRLVALVSDKKGVQCSISGYKFRDNNENGVIDEGDEKLPGWEIYLNDGDGCSYNPEDPEPTVTTNQDGYYEFSNLDKGTYYVCERQKSGWDQVIPGLEVKYHTVVLIDSSKENVNFLNTMTKDPCDVEPDYGYEYDAVKIFTSILSDVVIDQYEYSVSGCKFEGDSDTRLSGWQIYVDLNKDGQYNDGEPTDTTDSQGYYKINFNSGDYSLPFHVREVIQSGWEQIFPGSPNYYHAVYLGIEDKTAKGINFRNVELPDPCEEIDLIKNGGFEAPDVTNGSQWDVFPSGTSGLEWAIDWTGVVPATYDGDTKPNPANIELHSGVNGWNPSEGAQYAELDSDWEGPAGNTSGEPANTSLTQTVSAATGVTYKLKFDFSPRPGVSSNIMEVYWNGNLVATINQDGSSNFNTAWQTYSYDLVGVDGDDVLEFREVGNPDSLGSFLDKVSLIGCERGSGGDGYSIAGNVYDDQDEDSDKNGSDQGLPNWTVKLWQYVYNEDESSGWQVVDTDLSDANGDYLFDNLEQDCYIVEEQVESGWIQTEPGDDFKYYVILGNAKCSFPEALPEQSETLTQAILNLFVKTANAAMSNLINEPDGTAIGLDFGNSDGGGSSTSGGGGSSGSRSGRVLGDSTGLPYQAPQVLGATTELPRTGTPIAILFSLFGILAIIMIPKFAELKR